MAIHATKLHQPRPRANWLIRERLLAQLDRGVEAPRLILVSAPAGAGKTTLLAHWLAARPYPAAWLSLDEEDDSPVRFWSCVIQALQTAIPGLGQAALESLASPTPPPLASVLPSLANEIGALEDAPGAPLVVVLDDYHLLSSRAIHDSITRVVDHLPETLRVVVCARSDPPLPLARWRARDQLAEVREADLRFTPEEALDFLNQRMDLRLAIDDAARLVESTEGWAAGLQLAALSLQGQADPSQAIRSLGGTKRFMLEYLLEEVLARQPAATQEFLLRTAILDRMCGPLCDAVTGRPGGEAALAELQRQNLFVVPLDEERWWYRYHHLFADLLRARLQQTAPDQIPSLHLRASEWYEAASGLPEALAGALRHALAARDTQRAARLIQARERDWWTGSDVAIIATGLIAQLPDEIVLGSPNLSVYKGWGQLLRGHLRESEALFANVERLLTTSDLRNEDRCLLDFAVLNLAHIAELSGRPRPQKLDARILDCIPETRGGLRNSAEVVLAYLLYREGDFAGAARWLQATIDRDMRTGATNGIPIAASRLARMLIVEGRLREAEELCRRCWAVVEERGKWRFYVAGNLNIVLGDSLRERNRLEEAESCIRTGILDNEPWGIPHAYILGYTALARVLLAKGDVSGAAAALDRQDELSAGTQGALDLESEARAVRLRVFLAAGDMEAVAGCAATWAPLADAPPDFRGELDRLSLARAWIAVGRPRPAAALLRGMRESAARGGRARRSVEIYVLLALASRAAGEEAEAAAALRQALSLAAPLGCARVFLDEGPALLSLAAAAWPRAGLAPAERDFARAILSSAPQHSSPPATALVEPLTPREREVLSLLAAGFSNQDIASRLVITLAAVKKHTGNIYGKLGVTSRTQAIIRARELGLAGETPA